MADQDVTFVVVRNIPDFYHSSDLRNHFSELIETSGFACFHFRHRPEILFRQDSAEKANFENQVNPHNRVHKTRLCCIVKVYSARLQDLLKRYNGTHWCNKNGESIPLKCLIYKIKLKPKVITCTREFKNRSESREIPSDRDEVLFDDLKDFKELHPPLAMPNGNVGTPTRIFLNLIRSCSLPASAIKKLGLVFPRNRAKRMYGSVPLDYGTECISPMEGNDDEIVYSGDGRILSKYATAQESIDTNEVSDCIDVMKPESESDGDDDRGEEWDRHESLHNDVTQQERSKERLFEEEIELKWEKGGSGLVFYTDAQYWDELEGDFDAKTSDDWDVDTSAYYEPGAGDKDARDMLQMSKEKELREGSILHKHGIIHDKPFEANFSGNKRRKQLQCELESDSETDYQIGSFEAHTKGFGKRILKMQGWNEGQGLGKSVVGISEPIEDFGQHPRDKKGFGFRGEKLNRHPVLGNKKNKEVQICSVYCNPSASDPYVPINRSDFHTRLSYRKEFLKSKTLFHN